MSYNNVLRLIKKDIKLFRRIFECNKLLKKLLLYTIIIIGIITILILVYYTQYWSKNINKL